jgi:hypothetical protein
MTEYVILRHTGGESPAWVEADPGTSISASSATAAIKTAVAESGNTSGAYIAVPLRNFKPVKVVVETKPTVQIGELA